MTGGSCLGAYNLVKSLDQLLHSFLCHRLLLPGRELSAFACNATAIQTRQFLRNSSSDCLTAAAEYCSAHEFIQPPKKTFIH
jgi:hypothetical protein